MQPYQCPVCGGKQTIEPGFYRVKDESGDNTTCRTCNGEGIVWPSATVSGFTISDKVFHEALRGIYAEVGAAIQDGTATDEDVFDSIFHKYEKGGGFWASIDSALARLVQKSPPLDIKDLGYVIGIDLSPGHEQTAWTVGRPLPEGGLEVLDSGRTSETDFAIQVKDPDFALAYQVGINLLGTSPQITSWTVARPKPGGGYQLASCGTTDERDFVIRIDAVDQFVHPERRAVLDYLGALPEDMPIMVLTPQSYVEMRAAQRCVELMEEYAPEDSVWVKGSNNKCERMADYRKGSSTRSYMADIPPEVSPRLAGIPITEGDE